MFATLSELHAALLRREPGSFISHYIFEPIPFAFGDDLSAWIEWKTLLASLIDVDPKDIVLTGSAAVGYSLNPKKNYRPFAVGSDIDCGIVSDFYFDIAWRYLRQLRVSWLSLPSKAKYAITSHRERYVFAGTIATDQILALLPFGKTWAAALERMSSVEPTVGRDVNLRIYRDYDSLRYYQTQGLNQLRDSLAEEADGPADAEDGESAIRTEE